MDKVVVNQYVPDYVVSPGEVLDEYLDSYGMTQAELAAMAGVSPEEVNLLERGQPLHSEIARRLLLELGLRL